MTNQSNRAANALSQGTDWLINHCTYSIPAIQVEIVFPFKSLLFYYSAINVFSLVVIPGLCLSLLVCFLWWHFFLSGKGHDISRCSLPEAWLLEVMRFSWSVSKNLPQWKQAQEKQSSEASTRGHSWWSWWLPVFSVSLQDCPERTKPPGLCVTESCYYLNLCFQHPINLHSDSSSGKLCFV